MAFRRIDVPAEGALDDRKITLGGHDEQFAYAENSRADYIVGGLPISKTQAALTTAANMRSRLCNTAMNGVGQPNEEGGRRSP